jgi:hypothetical protein
MKVNGKVVDQPNEVLLVLPRDSGDLVFKFRAVVDSKAFEKMCPEPSPPKVKRTGGEVTFNFEDKDFKRSLNEWAARQTHWQFLTSINATEGLEWSRVILNDPGTWHLWRVEMEEAGFSIGELNAIWSHFVKANSLSTSLIEEARARFLSSEKAKADDLLSRMVVPSNSVSGEPASVSVLDQRVSEAAGKT